MFEALPRQSLRAFADHAPRCQQLPEHIARVEQPFKAGTVTLTNRFSNIDDYYEFRSVHILSKKVEVITVFLFPKPQWALPIYGMEMVLLGRKPIVGVLDAVNLHAGASAAPEFLTQARAQFDAIVQADDQPQWFLDCRSGAEFFIRPESVEELEALCPVHHGSMEAAAGLLAEPAPATDTQAHTDAIAAYKDHHRVNSPGLPLMNSVFGEAWTGDYMEGYLFA